MCKRVFSVDSAAELARSLPTTVPESPHAHQPRTPKTPRTPGRQDPNKTPRFYPVMKESGTIDGQVSTGCRDALLCVSKNRENHEWPRSTSCNNLILERSDKNQVRGDTEARYTFNSTSQIRVMTPTRVCEINPRGCEMINRIRTDFWYTKWCLFFQTFL